MKLTVNRNLDIESIPCNVPWIISNLVAKQVTLLKILPTDKSKKQSTADSCALNYKNHLSLSLINQKSIQALIGLNAATVKF